MGDVADDRKIALHERRGVDEKARIDVAAARDFDADAPRRIAAIVGFERIVAAAQTGREDDARHIGSWIRQRHGHGRAAHGHRCGRREASGHRQGIREDGGRPSRTTRALQLGNARFAPEIDELGERYRCENAQQDDDYDELDQRKARGQRLCTPSRLVQRESTAALNAPLELNQPALPLKSTPLNLTFLNPLRRLRAV